jgi:CheY-like chemotaxis protein
MISDTRMTELVRDALAQLYEPRALSAAQLAEELVHRGTIQTPYGLFDLLIATIERMKPPESAPVESHGWCCYRYLQRRYVDCCGHASIAAELGISVRQASRIHHEALIATARVLLGVGRSSLEPGLARSTPALSASEAEPRHGEKHGSNAFLKSELSLIAGLRLEETVDVADVISSVFATMQRMAESRRVELRADIGIILPTVRISRVALRQMLLNASVYLMGIPADDPDGTRSRSMLRLSAHVNVRGSSVTIDLESTGRRAVRGDKALQNTRESLLAAVKHLARQQGCDVTEEAGSSGRTALRLSLPTSDGVRTILLLDDNPDVGELLQRMLTGSPYHLVHVRTASRAIRIAQEVQPCVILLDIVLPVQDGWEVLATLRADPLTATIPIIVCSVLPDRELALSVGAADFLAKPIIRASLIQSLTRIQP